MGMRHSVFLSLVVLFFFIGLEVPVMIGTFAAFFCAAWDPVLLFLVCSSATRWLAVFYLPHMVSPPGLPLQAVREAGSVLFVFGAPGFVGCAGMAYLSKLTAARGVMRGPYRWIRHPQYLAPRRGPAHHPLAPLSHRRPLGGDGGAHWRLPLFVVGRVAALPIVPGGRADGAAPVPRHASCRSSKHDSRSATVLVHVCRSITSRKNDRRHRATRASGAWSRRRAG